MSGIYRAVDGDTFGLIARKTSGLDTDAARLKRANPGITEPIKAGTTIQIPGGLIAEAPILSGEDLEIVVDGVRLGIFDGFSLTYSVDAIRKAGFELPNEQQVRDIFVPLSSKEIKISFDGDTLLTGRIESPAAKNNPDAKTLGVSCYSLPGTLENSNPPASAFPLEFKDSNLEEITQQLCDLFGLDSFFDFEPGAKFKKVDIKEQDLVLAFLMKLAEQRNFVIADDQFGTLVFWRGEGLGGPVATWDPSLSHVNSIDGNINEGSYHSTVTGVMPARCKKKKQGKRYTVENPYKTGIIRPLTKEAKDIDEGELETFTRTLAGRMFGQVFKLTVKLSTWLDDNGALLAPNTLVRLKDPDNYVNDYYEFLIRNVTLEKNGSERTASVDLVLPSVFSGIIPESLPWET